MNVIKVCFLLTSIVCVTLCSAANAEISIGNTMDEVKAMLGEPDGEMKEGNSIIMLYSDGYIEFKDGKVLYFDVELNENIIEEAVEEVTDEKEKKSAAADIPAGEIKKDSSVGSGLVVRVYKQDGRTIDMKNVLVKGKVTIVDFYADWCGPCKRMSPELEKMANADKEVYLRKIDIVNWRTPVVEQYGIRSVPNIRVFNREGTMIGSPTSDVGTIKSYISKAKGS